MMGRRVSRNSAGVRDAQREAMASGVTLYVSAWMDSVVVTSYPPTRVLAYWVVGADGSVREAA